MNKIVLNLLSKIRFLKKEKVQTKDLNITKDVFKDKKKKSYTDHENYFYELISLNNHVPDLNKLKNKN